MPINMGCLVGIVDQISKEIVDHAVVECLQGDTLKMRSEKLHKGSTKILGWDPESCAWAIVFEGAFSESNIDPRGPRYEIEVIKDNWAFLKH